MADGATEHAASAAVASSPATTPDEVGGDGGGSSLDDAIKVPSSPPSDEDDGGGRSRSDDDTASTSSSSSSSSGTVLDEGMPLLKYARLVGSLPHDRGGGGGSTPSLLSSPCAASAIGRVPAVPPPSSSAGGSIGGTGSTGGGDAMTAATAGVVGFGGIGGGGAGVASPASSLAKALTSGSSGGSGVGGSSDDLEGGAANGNDDADAGEDRIRHVSALGFRSGELHLIDPRTGRAVVRHSELTVSDPATAAAGRSRGHPHGYGANRPFSGAGGGHSYSSSIVDVSFDASGSYLAAIDDEGDCAVFELRYVRATDVRGRDGSAGGVTAPSPASAPAPAAATAAAQFTSFFTTFGGGTAQQPTAPPPPPPPLPPPPDLSSRSLSYAGGLTVQTPISTVRLPYPRTTHSRPTCLVLDPSYKRRRDKALLVGFADGRVILTKRKPPLMFGRREDSVLYQGLRGYGSSGRSQGVGGDGRSNRAAMGAGGGGDPDWQYGGVERLAWRGKLVAWADASGIKIFDIETMSRIALVDRPVGARPSLYPTVSTLRPSLVFERSDSLLIGWGDCVMTMSIKETGGHHAATAGGGGGGGPTADARRRAEPSSASSSAGGGTGGGSGSTTAVVKRRTVSCTMAWELDCVACGVAPLDEDHVAVLGLVAIDEDEEEEEERKEASDDDDGEACRVRTAAGEEGNVLELQVISRSGGTVTSSDALPLLRRPPPPGPPSAAAAPSAASSSAAGLRRREAASGYALTSTYAVPRMDDATEAEEEALSGGGDAGVGGPDDPFDLGNAIFSTVGGGGAAGEGSAGGGGGRGGRRTFVDPHLKWSIESVTGTEDGGGGGGGGGGGDAPPSGTGGAPPEADGDDDKGVVKEADGDDDDDLSEASDDYLSPLRPTSSDLVPPPPPSDPPLMVLTSPADAILVRARDADDAVSHARAAGRAGLALSRALRHRRLLRRHSLDALVDEYLAALLRLDADGGARETDGGGRLETERGGNGRKELTLKRVRLAARSMPTLIGGNVGMWNRWSYEFAEIPGGLYVLREHLPVRDPKLPKSLYEMVLERMLQEVEGMKQGGASPRTARKVGRSAAAARSGRLREDATEHYLNALRAWGPTSAIRERIGLLREGDPARERSEIDLQVRMHQTAAGYLASAPAAAAAGAGLAGPAREIPRTNRHAADLPTGVTPDSLFDVEKVSSKLLPRLPFGDEVGRERPGTGTGLENGDIALEALAELHFMRGRYEESLRMYLSLGGWFGHPSLSTLKARAIDAVNGRRQGGGIGGGATARPSSVPALIIPRCPHVLAMIESHRMHRFLLEQNFLPIASDDADVEAVGDARASPLISLIRLVGLELSGRFLVENCVPPAAGGATSSARRGGEPAANLPLNMVADRLRPVPELLHWYLHQIFVHKPELYVRFPNFSVPPRSITELHRTHLELYVRYADHGCDDDGEDGTNPQASTPVPSYKLAKEESPLMSFLKAALPHGGARPDDVRRLLESHRAGKTDVSLSGKFDRTNRIVKYPKLFALELAYVIERSSSDTEEDAKTILRLYLEGAESLMLAVSFAERHSSHSGMLWEMLVAHCVHPTAGGVGENDDGRADGSLFGSLLEAAAQCGADLAHLVSRIPQGMSIEGLRPKLVSAVADYRLKLKMHEAAADILKEDKVALLRELSHRSRRGRRVNVPGSIGRGGVPSAGCDAGNALNKKDNNASGRLENKNLKQKIAMRRRKVTHRPSLLIPLR